MDQNKGAHREGKGIQSNWHLSHNKYVPVIVPHVRNFPHIIALWNGITFYSKWWSQDANAGVSCRKATALSQCFMLPPPLFWSSEFYSSWRWGEMGSVGLQRRSTKCKLCLSPVRLHLAGIQRMLGFPQNPSSLTLRRCHLWALPRPACFSVILLQSIVREKSRMRWGNTERICWHLTDPEWTITEDIFSRLQKKKKKATNFFKFGKKQT